MAWYSYTVTALSSKLPPVMGCDWRTIRIVPVRIIETSIYLKPNRNYVKPNAALIQIVMLSLT